HDDALARHLGQEIVAGGRERLRAAHADPPAGEDAVRLFRVEHLRRVVGLRQGPDLPGQRVPAIDRGSAHGVVTRRSTRPGRGRPAAPASYTTAPFTQTRWMPTERAWGSRV